MWEPLCDGLRTRLPEWEPRGHRRNYILLLGGKQHPVGAWVELAEVGLVRVTVRHASPDVMRREGLSWLIAGEGEVVAERVCDLDQAVGCVEELLGNPRSGA
jgi:hypothetical protein